MPGSCICSGLPVANCLRQLCPLGTRSLSAQASVCGSRTVGCPEFIRGIQFRPLGRNSLTTFRGQTALRGCPRARGVRCRIAPCRSLCSPPTLPAGRFGLRPRPHWGHASLRDSSLRSPAGKKALIAHFDGGARNVARDIVGELSPSFVRAPVLAFFRRQNGRAFFPPLPIAALLRRRLGGDEGQIARVGMLPRCPADFATQKADGVSKSCWPVVRAGGPIAQRRSVQANCQGIAPDPRAVAPVVPRR